MPSYNVQISIGVYQDGQGHYDTISRTIKVKDLESMARLIGRVLQHLPEDKK